MFTKHNMRPRKSSLVQLMQEHRRDAKKADSGTLKKFHWVMAFDYLDLIRAYYGSSKEEA